MIRFFSNLVLLSNGTAEENRDTNRILIWLVSLVNKLHFTTWKEQKHVHSNISIKIKLETVFYLDMQNIITNKSVHDNGICTMHRFKEKLKYTKTKNVTWCDQFFKNNNNFYFSLIKEKLIQ